MLNPAKSSQIPGIPWSSWWNPPFPSLGEISKSLAGAGADLTSPTARKGEGVLHQNGGPKLKSNWKSSNVTTQWFWIIWAAHVRIFIGCSEFQLIIYEHPMCWPNENPHIQEKNPWNTGGNAGFLHANVTISRWTLHLFMLDVPRCSDAPSAGPLPWYWNVSQSTCLRPFHSNYLAGVPPILDHWPMPLRFCQLFTTFYDLLFVIPPYFCNLFLTNLWESPRASHKLLHDDSWKPKNAAASTQPSDLKSQKYHVNHIAEFMNLFWPRMFT